MKTAIIMGLMTITIIFKITITFIQLLIIHHISPVTMHKPGGLVHAPMNCTTFLCRTFLQVPSASLYMHTFLK